MARQKRILSIVGTRPNFVKIAALYRELEKREAFDPVLVHTGQHYDDNMSRVFFDDLNLPRPDADLEVGAGSYVYQTSRIIERLEPFLTDPAPDLMIVVGDVNSTLAAATAAMNAFVPVAHVEAGLRSFDRTMPEEMNRVVVDNIADYLFVTEQAGIDNLRKEGVPDERMFLVGNVMVDTLLANLERAKAVASDGSISFPEDPFALATIHRAASADDRDVLSNMLDALVEVSRTLPLLFPVHPRTRRKMDEFGLSAMIDGEKGFHMIEPLGYLEFLAAMSKTRVVLSDSGGIQPETTMLGVPCITMRPTTECPATIEHGTNRLAGTTRDGILSAFGEVMDGPSRPVMRPPLWDGHAAGRILDVLEDRL